MTAPVLAAGASDAVVELIEADDDDALDGSGIEEADEELCAIIEGSRSRNANAKISRNCRISELGTTCPRASLSKLPYSGEVTTCGEG